MAKDPKEAETGTGEETKAELVVGNHVANVIHMFLSLLAILLLVAALIATYDIVIREFPKLWRDADEYVALQSIIQSLLLVAITVEFALLLLFRRMSAVVEVLVFVLARKALHPDIHSYELALISVAIAGLIVLRFYYLPGKTT